MKMNIKWSIGIISMLLLTSVSTYAQQVTIGKESIEFKSSILEFADMQNKGMVLPVFAKDNLDKESVAGTLFLDETQKKVLLFLGEEKYMDLSVTPGEVNLEYYNGVQEISGVQSSISLEPNLTIPGVLVLQSDSKALVLPRVESPHLNIKNPTAGTIAYDTNSKMLCIYNGKDWSFWASDVK
ncbi:hypothetical protein NWE55_13355 [Myroides albus]|uniref:Uncharacterized protein n=1 Tax=Myroides albus TaxID=2562892 RepID=A0A6I3LTX0_9FLAO|nr:hypothetical protein [Myroides albus]MTG99392.1 hypothetical protein [Myroides albus]UVD79100.1 hypothetical protein NWE55_13355 [Myroides albus]